MKKFYLINVLFIFFTIGCAPQKKDSNDLKSEYIFSESISSNDESNDSSFKADKDELIFSNENFRFSNFIFESLKDIDDNNGLFVYCDFTNLKSEELLPDSVWQQYFSISIDEIGIQDSLYPTVLPKKLLDESEYKSAIDLATVSVKKDSTVTVGFFYRTDGKNVKLTFYDDDHKIIAILNNIK